MKWHKLTTIADLPKDRGFLLWDEACTSGISVYEAMMFDSGNMGCPATFEEYQVDQFTHWAEIEKPGDTTDTGLTVTEKMEFAQKFIALLKE